MPSLASSALIPVSVLLRGGPSYQLPNTQAADGNVAVFQLTATLPFSFEVAFLGGPSAEQKTMGGPMTMCAGCSPSEKTKSESHSKRLGALSGRLILHFGVNSKGSEGFTPVQYSSDLVAARM